MTKTEALSEGDYLLGISSGHKRASALLYTHSTQPDLYYSTFASSLNIHAIRPGASRSRLADFLRQILFERGISAKELKARLRSCVISYPGAGSEVDQKTCLDASSVNCLDGVPKEIVDDTWAGLYAHTEKRSGICAFAGAGASVAIASGSFIPCDKYKIDGWGPLIGDFGSGFDLVTRYFRRLGRLRDHGESSPLFSSIKEHCANTIPIESLDKVQPWFELFGVQYGTEWRAHFSELAIPILAADDSVTAGVGSHSQEAQQEAHGLVIEVAKSMYESIELAIERCKAEFNRGRLQIVLQGGLFRNSKSYTSWIKRKIKRLHSHDAIVATRRPVVGAILLAAERFEPKDDLRNLCDRLTYT